MNNDVSMFVVVAVVVLDMSAVRLVDEQVEVMEILEMTVGLCSIR